MAGRGFHNPSIQACRDSGKILPKLFPGIFSEVFSGTPRKNNRNSHGLIEFSDKSWSTVDQPLKFPDALNAIGRRKTRRAQTQVLKRAPQKSAKVRDAETTILIKFAFWRRLGRGTFTENCPKTLFFLGNSMTIKFGNFANFIVRNFVVIWEAPKKGASG